MQSPLDRRRGGVLGVFVLLAGACVAPPFPGSADEPEGTPDGARCEQDDDCKSTRCNKSTRLCAHSYCDCPGDTCTAGGEVSADCADGWVCSYYESIFGPVADFFMIDRDDDGGVCQPKCQPECPEHYVCKDGRFCVANYDWANPSVTIHWSGALEGDSRTGLGREDNILVEKGTRVMLRASATSPIGAPMKRFEWRLVADTSVQAELTGETAELFIDETTAFGRAELVVHDDESRTGRADVAFKGCAGAGKACGYQGSGCCSDSCDTETKLCR